MPAPLSDTWQRIENLQFDSLVRHRLAVGGYGNLCAHAQLEPGAAMEMSFIATRTERILRAKPLTTPVPDRGPDCCLSPDRLVPVDGKIRDWAREVVGNDDAATDIQKARAIYNHVVATVKYDKSGKGWGRGDIYYACDARRGNCTDFHAIFIGYCRAVGVPARFAIGLPLPSGRRAGEIEGYHCWAEFYAGGVGWVPVDASEAAKDPARREYFFGAHDENRVELSKGRDLILAPPQRGAPLNYFVYPYAELDNGKPFDELKISITFRDVSA